MDKQLRNKGFTFVEMMLVLTILSIFLLLTIPITKQAIQKPVQFCINDIVYLQYQAIVENEKKEYKEYECEISFNRKGNVNKANTYYIEEIGVIVSLGTGRVYVKQQP